MTTRRMSNVHTEHLQWVDINESIWSTIELRQPGQLVMDWMFYACDRNPDNHSPERILDVNIAVHRDGAQV